MTEQLLLIASGYIVFGVFEITFGAERNHSIAGRVRNLIYAALLFGSSYWFAKLIPVLFPFKPKYLPDRGILFSILMVFVYAFLMDFIFYWYHRAQHRFPFLWTIHELHHSDTELNVTTTLRTYWLDRPIQTVLIVLPIIYGIGIERRASAILPFVLGNWMIFIHTNWRLRLGFLTPVICGPQVHRIHHSTMPQHLNKNLAQYFPVLDILFGTYYAPARDEFPGTGTAGLASDASVGNVLVRPFQVWLKGLQDLTGASKLGKSGK